MAQAKRAFSKSTSPEGKTLTFAPAPHAPSGPSLDEQIRQRAYELYEQRGRHEGLAEADWLRAESEVRSRQAKRTA